MRASVIRSPSCSKSSICSKVHKRLVATSREPCLLYLLFHCASLACSHIFFFPCTFSLLHLQVIVCILQSQHSRSMFTLFLLRQVLLEESGSLELEVSRLREKVYSPQHTHDYKMVAAFKHNTASRIIFPVHFLVCSNSRLHLLFAEFAEFDIHTTNMHEPHPWPERNG